MSVSPAGLSGVEQRLADALAARADSMRTDLARHVRIPTGWNHKAGLDEYRGLLLERVSALGAAVELVEGDARPQWLLGRDEGAMPPIAICRHERGDAKARVLIACHLDTVFDPRGGFNDFIESADGATAVGPGVVDMKGGILVALNALEALEEAGVPTAWTLVLTSDEETGSFSSERALRETARGHDFGICTEPALPGGELAIERMGSGQFMVECFGRASHVGRDFTGGVSAVTALARALVRIGEMPEPSKGRILSVGPLKGGDATNAVPDHACAWGNVRFPTPDVAESIATMLDDLATREDAMPRISVRRSFNRPAKPLIPETESFARLAREAAEALGQRLPFASTGGVCDGNILQDAGLPTIDTLGVRGGGLHTPQEWIELRSLPERGALFAVLMARLGAGAAG